MNKYLIISFSLITYYLNAVPAQFQQAAKDRDTMQTIFSSNMNFLGKALPLEFKLFCNTIFQNEPDLLTILNNFNQTNASFYGQTTQKPVGYTAIGIAAASPTLKKAALTSIVIDLLINRVGIQPTNKDKDMIRLHQWEIDEANRKTMT